VAQPGSALVWGARGRQFESGLPDKNKRAIIDGFFWFKHELSGTTKQNNKRLSLFCKYKNTRIQIITIYD
jgi:hypothetical protein